MQGTQHLFEYRHVDIQILFYRKQVRNIHPRSFHEKALLFFNDIEREREREIQRLPSNIFFKRI